MQEESGWSIQLLGGFELHGPTGVIEVTPGVQRLLAYIALQGGSVARSRAARELWPSVPAGQAGANLRSALWRARRLGPLVRPGPTTLRLDPCVFVDVELLAPGRALGGRLGQVGRFTSGFNLELLPDWSDDWVSMERERLRHLGLQVLDEQVAELLSRGRVSEALDTALRAIRLEPLRESSHQTLIRLFLEAGNRSAAISHYEGFVDLLRDELDLGPDPRTTALVQPFLRARPRTARAWRQNGNARRGPTRWG